LKAKKLFDILPTGGGYQTIGSLDKIVTSFTIDSRKVQKDSIYAAFKGTLSDGHSFISQAIQLGAVCVICEKLPDAPAEDVTWIVTGEVRSLTGTMLDLFYDHPTGSMKLVGVTGTNGKTTVATLLHQLFSEMGHICGLISTVQNQIGAEILPSTHTTPDIVSLHAILHEMKERRCEYVFMEVSSHAADQQRIAGLFFTGALFTNITHDHLDYHGTMKSYITAKKLFFDGLSKDAFALVNADDKNGKVMVQQCKARIRTYSLRTMADYKTRLLDNTLHGLHLRINDIEADFRLTGSFNASNLTLVFGTAVELGEDSMKVITILSGLTGARGRFERVFDPRSGKFGIIDYAHTPDALENVIQTIRQIRKPGQQIISVVGCGGNRDAGKRPIMARVAASGSDKVVLTSDNPRFEDAEMILDQMEEGLDAEMRTNVLRITDRLSAIKTAVMLAGEGDIILVAGKGHENYQEIKGEKFPFDDKEVLESCF
jgi:UDP-N-acetylmuramoyl-L-alanyl-D-glutamate--2,6-diaminopimelate ligase